VKTKWSTPYHMAFSSHIMVIYCAAFVSLLFWCSYWLPENLFSPWMSAWMARVCQQEHGIYQASAVNRLNQHPSPMHRQWQPKYYDTSELADEGDGSYTSDEVLDAGKHRKNWKTPKSPSKGSKGHYEKVHQ
jgi:hypothetical protein